MKITIKGSEPVEETFPCIRQGGESKCLYFFHKKTSMGVCLKDHKVAPYDHTEEFKGVITIEQGV
tara:strand:- start:4914 stop:5108 length:195 start_codon:yes stop_codon:yes gene_type:complete